MKRLLAALIVLACSSPLYGQSAEPVGIQTGTRMRIAADGPKVVGAFVRATPDSVHLINQQGRPQSFMSSSISSVDVSAGHPVHSGRVAKGALLGAAIVGAVGAGAIAVGGDGGSGGDEGYAWMGLAVLAPISAIVGGIWAARTAPEQWESVPVASLSANGAQRQAAMVPVAGRSKGNGKKIAIGALIGGTAGAIFAGTQRSSAPAAGRMTVAIVPGVLIGGGIGALMH
ncbi:MAG: hypothetical protein ACJ8AJ_14010 [Gemmatimonadaceae bacterium]